MTEQEREHWDFEAGRASEFQNCFTEATSRAIELCAREANKIEAALARGRVVVVQDEPYHCKATDAVAGVVPTYLGDFPTRREALNFAAQAEDLEWAQIYLLPRESVFASEVRPVPQDDIPF